MKDSLPAFENYKIRRIYDADKEVWYFSIIDIIQILLGHEDYQASRNYWKVLKNRLNKEGSETVTKCNQLKLAAEDGKMRMTDVADPETLLRIYSFDSGYILKTIISFLKFHLHFYY